MDNLIGRYRNVSILAAAIFLQIVGLAVQVKRSSQNQSTRLIRVWTVAAITPIEKNIVRLQGGVSDIWYNYMYSRGVPSKTASFKTRSSSCSLRRLRQDAEQAHYSPPWFKEHHRQDSSPQVIVERREQSRLVSDKGSAEGIFRTGVVISQRAWWVAMQVLAHCAGIAGQRPETAACTTLGAMRPWSAEGAPPRIILMGSWRRKRSAGTCYQRR
jgi:hypothetical protein